MVQSPLQPATAKRVVQRKTKNNTLLTAPLTLNPDAFQTGLMNHEDQAFVKMIVDSCKHGVNIGYEGPAVQRICKNWPSTVALSSAVEQSIAKDISMGRKLGPFNEIPFSDFIVSPMGAFKKRRSNKVRVIHDLSYPSGVSVNDFISKEKYTLSYMSIDDVVEKVQQYGKGALMAKLDLQDAYHYCLVRPEDWHLLGTSYGESEGNRQFYFSTVLPFGLRSSPYLFTQFAHATRLIMQYKGVTFVNHYLDDYITTGPPATDECEKNLDIMLQVCQSVGFAVNPSKVVTATPVIEFLGIIIDATKFELRISDDRLEDTMLELSKWRTRTWARKREVLSLVGKLTFISRVVRSGRTFTRRLIDLSKKVKHLHHIIRLNKAFQADIDWWWFFLPTWNGVSIMYDPHWTSDVEMDLHSDASNIAVAAYFAGDWFVEMVPDLQHSINWRELYAVVLAAATFGRQWRGRRIIFHCDNQSVVYILQSGTSKSPELMKLVRLLFYLSATHQFEFTSSYINTKINAIADSLSRLDFYRFWRLVPSANPRMTMPCSGVVEAYQFL